MRTTLNLDDDVLAAAKAIAARNGHSLGQVVSDLARETLEAQKPKVEFRNGIPLLPNRKGVVVTTEHINALREELD